MIANVLTIAGTDPSGGAGISGHLEIHSVVRIFQISIIQDFLRRILPLHQALGAESVRLGPHARPGMPATASGFGPACVPEHRAAPSGLWITWRPGFPAPGVAAGVDGRGVRRAQVSGKAGLPAAGQGAITGGRPGWGPRARDGVDRRHASGDCQVGWTLVRPRAPRMDGWRIRSRPGSSTSCRACCTSPSSLWRSCRPTAR